jgi:hypothetical protein
MRGHGVESGGQGAVETNRGEDSFDLTSNALVAVCEPKCVAHLTAIAWNQREATSLPIGISGERFMRNTLLFLSLAAGLAIACAASGNAAPINAAAVKEVATTASQVQPVRYRRYYRRYGWGWGYTKCYREFAIGPYNCHWFPL